jgi:hypothetical protein
VVGLEQIVGALGSRWGGLAAAAAIALPVTALVNGYSAADLSRRDPQTEVDAAIRAVSDNSLIFTPDNGTRHLFSYRLLPQGLAARRNVWVSRGPGADFEPDRAVVRIRDYCAPEPGPWVWAPQERAIAPSVARGLHTYIYGYGYARQVRDSGFRLTHVSGKLYRFQCSSTRSSR